MAFKWWNKCRSAPSLTRITPVISRPSARRWGICFNGRDPIMSQLVPPPPRVINIRRDFVLVASQFNGKYVEGLVHHCSEELRALCPASNVTRILVPGAFEIPLVVRE